MDKLIITVACDSRTSYPINHLCPPQEDIEGVARQYLDALSAGAAIAHIHGIRTLEESMQADGRQVSRMDQEGWKRLNDAIMSRSDWPLGSSARAAIACASPVVSSIGISVTSSSEAL